MGILDNLENALDDEFNFESSLYKPEMDSLAVKIFSETVCAECESKSMPVTDNMGREKFWEDLGRPEYENLAVKIFSETCCTDCSCKNG